MHRGSGTGAGAVLFMLASTAERRVDSERAGEGAGAGAGAARELLHRIPKGAAQGAGVLVYERVGGTVPNVSARGAESCLCILALACEILVVLSASHKLDCESSD